MYAMRTPEEVLERLGKYGTTHILVENSICYQGGRKEDNCATPDLLDLANNHLESDRTTKKVPKPIPIHRGESWSEWTCLDTPDPNRINHFF